MREDGDVRIITLDRPEIRNALTVDDLAVITAAVRELPESVRAVVLRSDDDRTFSAGMHIDTFVATPADRGHDIIDRVGECVGAIRLVPVPTIAVITGYCLGAGFEIALACDLRVSTPDAVFGLPEVRLGIPSVVDAALLVHHVGLSKAKELMLTGAQYTIAELPPGLVNRVAPASEHGRVVDELVAMMRASTREVLAAQKGLFETWLNTGLQEGIDRSRDVFADVFALPVTQQAVDGYRVSRRREPPPPA